MRWPKRLGNGKKKDRVTLLVVIGTTGVIFVANLLSPPGLASCVLYLVPLIVTCSLPNRTAPLLFAAIATVLILMGTFHSRSTVPSWLMLGNDVLAIAVLWISLSLLRHFEKRFPPLPNPADSLHEEQKRLRHLFGERVKELTALHRTVHLLQDSAKPIEEVLRQIVALLPPAWQYPDIAAARITFKDLAFTTPTFVESPWKQTASWVTMDDAKGMIEVIYREARSTEAEGPFLSEERDLINSLADSLSSYLNRRYAEQALREAHERLQALSQQLMEVQEHERRRLALDLHDEIGQALTVVKMNLQTMQRLGSASDTRTLKDSLDVIEQTLQHVRALSLDLRPSLLDDLGLVPAVRWYVTRQAERAGWAIDVQVDESLPPLPQEAAIACFRVIQEAVTNIIRHSKATRVCVSLQRQGSELRLRIHDNGVGFDVQRALIKAAKQGQSMGLIGMQERIRSLNGSFAITSDPEQGTEVCVRVPVASFSPSLQTQGSLS